MPHGLAYHRPASLGEACALLAELGEEALPLAGGTDVLVDLRRGAGQARHVVSLRDLEELRGVRLEEDGLRIGALTTPAELAASEVLQGARPELIEVVQVFAGPQIRNRATVGGNLCTATSCADFPPLLIALGARVRLVGPDGARDLALEDFFVDARKTALGPGEVLVEISVPARIPGEGARYEAFGLRAGSFITVAGVAAVLRLAGEVCLGARVVLGAVGPTPLLVREVEVLLLDRAPDDDALREAAAAATAAALPISDVRGSAEHRRDVVRALAMRALVTARERARS